MNPSELLNWAAQEIRDLDELARAMIPGYEPLDSDDMGRLKALKKMAEDSAWLEDEVGM